LEKGTSDASQPKFVEADTIETIDEPLSLPWPVLEAKEVTMLGSLVRLFSAAFLLAFALECSGQQVSLTGAGATFPYPVYSKWFSEYHNLHHNVQITSQSIGSGLGIRRFNDGEVDFGASDAPLNDVQVMSFSDRHWSGVLHFPSVVGAVVPAYNLPGASVDLNFTPQALAGIFLGQITKWNDPELAKANPKVKLPGNDIMLIHRSDPSGTTYVWSDYLAKVSFEFRQRFGRDTLISWPVGRGAAGNQGVADLIRQTPYSLGYVELAYARQQKLSYGGVRNSSGAFVKADLASVTAAADAAAPFLPDDFRFSIANSPARSAYPISSFTWLVVPSEIKDKAKLDAMRAFLSWMLGPGQNMVEALGFSRLPQSVVAREVETISLLR
jgi:phosphate transport system substrate-binding protein